MRRTYTGTTAVIVNCDDCGWHYEGMNGVGLAAQHSDRHDHTVHVDIARSVSYTPRGSAYDQEQQARLGGGA